MNESSLASALEALTRSDVCRRDLFPKGFSTDDALIDTVAGRKIGASRKALLSAISRLLRLMHGLLVGTETGEGFVSKFSDQWLLITDWDSDGELANEFDSLNQFYSEISFFCANSEERGAEPLLFGLEQLRERTGKVYEKLRKKFAMTLLNLT